MTKVAKLFVLPGNPYSKAEIGKRTRVFLADGTEIPKVISLEVLSFKPQSIDGLREPTPKVLFGNMLMELNGVKVVTVSKRPERKRK